MVRIISFDDGSVCAGHYELRRQHYVEKRAIHTTFGPSFPASDDFEQVPVDALPAQQF